VVRATEIERAEGYRNNLRLLNQGLRILELRIGVARSLEYLKMDKLGLQRHKD
jgi:hypothetical protein